MSKEIKIIIPLLNSEMDQVNNLSKPIVNVIINSTVKAVLEQTNQNPNIIDTVITQFIVRPDIEE